MFRIIGLGVAYFAIWLLLSGYVEPLLMSFGVLSCCLVLIMAHRMGVIDHEGYPVHLSGRICLYWPWLIWQVIKSNLVVARCILDPALPISPTMVRVKSTQRSDLGRAIFANSITLTPGTVSTYLENDEIQVHALTREAAEDLLAGEMNQRVTDLEGGD